MSSQLSNLLTPLLAARLEPNFTPSHGPVVPPEPAIIDDGGFRLQLPWEVLCLITEYRSCGLYDPQLVSTFPDEFMQDWHKKCNIFVERIEDIESVTIIMCVGGMIHNTIGPAVITERKIGTLGRTEEWYVGGTLHRDDGPALCFQGISHRTRMCSSETRYYCYGKRHRSDGPASICKRSMMSDDGNLSRTIYEENKYWLDGLPVDYL